MISKKIPGLFLIAALPLLAFVTWTPDVHAQSDPKSKTAEVPLPLGKRCAVSIVSVVDSSQVAATSVNPSTKAAPPTVAEGILIRMDSEWIVLRDGNSDHWISTNKVMIITASQ